MKIAACIFGFFTTLAVAIEPHTAVYQLSVHDIEIATETRELKSENGRFIYTANAQSAGLLGVFQDIKIFSKSEFFINGNGVQSVKYQYRETEGETVEKDIEITIDEKMNIATVHHPDAKKFTGGDNNIVDPLGLFIALPVAILKNPDAPEWHFSVVNEKTLEDKIFRNAGVQILQWNETEIETQKAEQISKPVRAWFAKQFGWLPFRIERENFRYELVEFSAAPKP